MSVCVSATVSPVKTPLTLTPTHKNKKKNIHTLTHLQPRVRGQALLAQQALGLAVELLHHLAGQEAGLLCFGLCFVEREMVKEGVSGERREAAGSAFEFASPRAAADRHFLSLPSLSSPESPSTCPHPGA